MTDNGYYDDTVQPRDGVFTAEEPAIPGAPAQFMPAQFTPVTPGIPAEPLQPAQFMPAQYSPEQFTPAIPAEPALPADGTPLQYGERIQAPLANGTPLQAGERIEALPADSTPLEAGERIEAPLAPGAVQPRDGVFTSSPLQPFQRAEAQELPPGATGTPATPRLRDLEPEQAEPRALESTKPAMLDREAAPPSGDNGDKPPTGGDNPPSGNDYPPSGSDTPPSSGNPPSTTGKGGPAVAVNTGKLAPIAPGLNGIMRDMFSIGNSTANGVGAYRLNRGDSFGEAYEKTATPIATQILEGLANAGSVFGDAAEGASLTVHNYDVTEDNAVESAHGLLSSSEE